MTPEQMRDLDARAGQAITAVARPLLPWLAALYVAVGCPALAWYIGSPPAQVLAAGSLGGAMAIAGLIHWRRSQRVSSDQGGQ